MRTMPAESPAQLALPSSYDPAKITAWSRARIQAIQAEPSPESQKAHASELTQRIEQLSFALLEFRQRIFAIAPGGITLARPHFIEMQPGRFEIAEALNIIIRDPQACDVPAGARALQGMTVNPVLTKQGLVLVPQLEHYLITAEKNVLVQLLERALQPNNRKLAGRFTPVKNYTVTDPGSVAAMQLIAQFLEQFPSAPNLNRPINNLFKRVGIPGLRSEITAIQIANNEPGAPEPRRFMH